MTFSSLRSFHAASRKHHDRGLTLVFGSNGQVSLIGFDDGTQTQTPGASPTLTVGDTGTLTPTLPLPKESTSASPVPNLEATSASLTDSASFMSTSTSPSLTSSSISASTATDTDTDTNLPSIPTINYPTPTPTAVSDPRDHGVGAPFYLAMVLASISLIGCISAFIAWWIRSRTRRRPLQFDDPWDHRKATSDDGSIANDANQSAKGAQSNAGMQEQPYYLPASIVHSGSSNLHAVPHTILTSEDTIAQNDVPRTILDARLLRRPSPRSQNTGPESSLFSSEATDLYSRPGTERLQTGLSVQESTHTLGKLRVTNRVPGDVTSGDEGGVNMQNGANASPGTNLSTTNPAFVGEGAEREVRVDSSDQSIQDRYSILDPPGPATMSWGRRIDTVAALRRTRRHPPKSTAWTYENPKYGGYWHPTPDARQLDLTSQVPLAVGQRDNRTLVNPSADSLGWTNSIKSSFRQAVDAMTGNRPLDSKQVRVANTGNGSGFTPAPQRITFRRPPSFPAHTDAIRTNRSQETETPRSSPTRINESGVVPHFNSGLGTSTYSLHPSVLKTETGSLYSTETATARANLRRYSYVDSIPSSWSALGASRQSQLELSRLFLPLPRPAPSSTRSPLSFTPEPSLRTGSPSIRTRTTTHSETSILGPDASTFRSGTSANMVRPGSTSNITQSGHRTTVSLRSSTRSSMLSRKKGVTRRKQPRPPARALSTASSVQSVESVLSVKDVAVRKALLERRRKIKATESVKDQGG